MQVSPGEIEELLARKLDLDERCEYILRQTRSLEGLMEVEEEFVKALKRSHHGYLQNEHAQACQQRFEQYIKRLHDARMSWLEQLQDVNEELTSTVSRLRDVGILR
jgi:hypothetical protein